MSFVGPLFLLNELVSDAIIATFLLGRPWLFLLGAVEISVGSVASIVVSRSTSFPGFAEHRYDARATTIVIVESAAMALVLLAGALAARSGLGVETERCPGDSMPSPRLNAVAAKVRVAVGVGQGPPPPRLSII